MQHCHVYAGKLVGCKEHFIQGFGNSLHSGSQTSATLRPGDYLQSSDGQYIMFYQHDGNLVMYPKSVWSTGTVADPGKAIMQKDGNFVLYDSKNRPYWATGTNKCNPESTQKCGPYRFTLQKDRNVVLYDYQNAPIWNSKTNIAYNGPCTANNC